MVELVDTLVLGTSALWRGGSTPSRGTRNFIYDTRSEYFLLPNKK